MKFNSFFKVLFDLVMLVLLAVVYCAQPTGIPVHEYTGLAIYLLFIIHLIYNYKWIINVGKKFFDKKVGARVKFMYAIEWLLLITFILIGFSGIMISHAIFKFGKMPVWRPLHSIVSAISVIFLAFHIGLHGRMILNAVKTKVKLPFAVIKTATLVLFVIILFAGIYGDVMSKIQPRQNQITGRPQYETVLALFGRSADLLSGPPEYVRNRTAGAGEKSGDNGGRPGGGTRPGEVQRPPQENKWDITTILVSVSNYLAFIILCSIIVYLVDNGVQKKINNESTHP